MKRYRQTFDEIEATLMPVAASWLDDHAKQVIQLLRGIPSQPVYGGAEIRHLLEEDFNVGTTVIRLLIDVSKDDYTQMLRDALGAGGIGVNRFKADPTAYVETLVSLGVGDALSAAVSTPVHWTDVLVERLKGGRGSAIKGQMRGRGMEDFVEEIVRSVFSPEQVAVRCRFTGAGGASTEKADFAVPAAVDPILLIEVKAYGATGSKQTDVLGDMARIIEQKRHDTLLMLFTDGITWRQRPNDLRKLVQLQNDGLIHRIYTQQMAAELKADLEAIRIEAHL